MKQKGLNGWRRVFCFTFGHLAGRKGWLLATLLPALLLLAAIPTIMLLCDRNASRGELSETSITEVIVADMTERDADYAMLNKTGDTLYSSLRYSKAADADAALRQAEANKTALVLTVERDAAGYTCEVIRPEHSSISSRESEHYADFLSSAFGVITVQKADVDFRTVAELNLPFYTASATSEAFRDDAKAGGFEAVREAAEMILPYLGLMLIYFLVLFYGQGVASSVISEKTSKLMDTVLLSLEPAALILGKLLAIALAGILQLGVWIAGGVFGCVAGERILLTIHPDSTLGILRFFDVLGQAGGLFSIGSVMVGILVIVAGFLMYCAIAAISGALASKPEDLGSTNSVFTLLLVFSFLITFFTRSSSSTSMVSDAVWLSYVPFTAVMCVPARAVLGQITLGTGLLSLGLILLVALLAVLLAGKLYSVTTFRRGKPPKLSDIPALLKSKG